MSDASTSSPTPGSPPATTPPPWAQVFRQPFAHGDPLPEPPPHRVLSGTYYRQTDARVAVLATYEDARSGGRYHAKGSESPVYASSNPDAAWGELFRHVEDGVSPFEVKRRMNRLQVTDLVVLDLTDPDIRTALGVSERDLTSNALKTCRRLARFARRWSDFDGILAPSAAVSGMETLVIFRRGLPHVAVPTTGRLGNPPLRLIYLFERVIETLPPRKRAQLYDFARDARSRVSNRTRRRGR